MSKDSEEALYKKLASVILPEGILKMFEVSDVNMEHTGVMEETGGERIIVRIHLSERDMRNEEWHGLRPNGFTEECQILDFPIRGHETRLHVRRRRWLDENGHNVVLPLDALTADGTSYSKELADGLKKIFGYLPSARPLP